jgi:PAS domain S-box-containing protein
MPPADLKVLVGWKEIAAYLGRSRSAAARLVEEGLPVFRVGRSVRALAADVDRWRAGERPVKNGDETKGDYSKSTEGIPRRILETVPIWLWETDPRGKFTYSNVASFDVLGYRPEELVGSKPSAFLVYQEDVPLFDGAFGKGRAKKAAVRNLRCRFLSREKELRWFEIDAEPAFDARGRFAGMRGVGRDVTARVRAEERERERLAILSTLSRTATDFVGFAPEGDLFAYAAERLRELVGDASVALTSYDEATDTFTVRAVSGLGGKTGTVLKALGKDPIGWTIPGTGKIRSSLLAGELRNITIPLHELSGGVISKKLSRKLQKVLGFGGIYLMGIVRQGKLLGLASVIPTRGAELRNPEFVEAFINQAAVAIQRKYAEDAYRESQEGYRALFQGSPTAVTVLSPAGIIVEVNKATEELTGYAANELCGKRFADLSTLASDDMSEAQTKYEALLKGKAGEPYDLEIIRKDGTKRWIRVRNSLLREGEKLTGIQVIGADITDRKRAQESLQESEEKFRNLVERANDGIAMVVEGRLTYANPRLSETTAYDAPQMLGEPFTRFIDPAELPKVKEYYRKRMRGEDVPTIYETAIRRADGSKMDVELNVGTFSYGGRTAELVFIRDLTERKKAEETRERERESFRIIAEAAVHAKSIRDLCRRVVTGLAEALGFEIGSLRLYEPQTDTLERTASCGMTRDEIDDYFPTQPLGDPRYFAARAGSTREPIFAPDVAKQDVAEVLGRRIEELGLAAIISWPILGTEGNLLGVINLASRTPQDIAEEDRAFFERVAGMFATVLERRRAEDEVRKSEAKHRLLLESIGSPVLALDGDMNLLYYNDAYAAFAGRPREEMEGKNLLELFPAFAETKTYAAYAETLETGIPHHVEDTFGERYLRTAVYPMPWGILAVAADVTESKRAVEALRASEEKYRNIFEHSPAGIVVHQEGKVAFLSPAMLRIIGYDSAEEVVGRPIMEFVHPDYRERLAEEIETVFGRGGELGEPSELIITGKDGSSLSVTSVAQTITYRGAPAIQAYVLNNAERKRAEEALRESEERYRVLFEGGNDAIFVFRLAADGTPSKFVEVNNEACRHLGYSAAELHELTPADLVPRQRRKAAADMMRRLVDEGELIFEWVHVRKDGTEVPVEISSHIFEFRGELTAISIVRDITERQRAEEAVRENEEKYRNLFQGSKDAIFVHDLDGNIFDANEQVSALFGYSAEETLSLRISDLHPPKALPASRRAFEEIARDGSVTFEVDFVRKDGSVFEAEVSASLFEIGGHKVIQGIVRDITDRKRAEEEIRRAEREKTAILSSMSEHVLYHDAELTILWANEAAASSVGLSPEALVGRHCYEVWHGRDRRCEACPVADALATGGPHEEEVTTPDGRVWFIRGYPIKDEEGNVTNAVEVTLEITERKRAEEALKQALAENEALLEAVPDLMFVIDAEGNYVDFKRADADKFALSPETIIGKNVRDTGFSAADEREILAGLERTLRTGEPSAVYYELDTPRGRGTFEARLVKLNDDEVLSVIREIKKRRGPQEN